MLQDSNLFAGYTVSRQIRRARLILHLSCDRQARTTARAARALWWSADLWLARAHWMHSLLSERLADEQARREFYRELRSMQSWGSTQH